MVKILSSGEIVGDDDVRTNQSRGSNSQGNSNRPRQGYIRHDDDGQDQDQQGQGQGQQVNMFDVLNQRLLNYGIPRWNAGPYVVEPIVSVGFVLAGLFMGLKGILFGGLLFFVTKWSQSGGGFSSLFGGGGGGGGNRRQQGPGSSGGRSPSGSGHRLGRT
ncbi:hypothetical protein ScPMuIL_005054 [Solemya velum]